MRKQLMLTFYDLCQGVNKCLVTLMKLLVQDENTFDKKITCILSKVEEKKGKYSFHDDVF